MAITAKLNTPHLTAKIARDTLSQTQSNTQNPIVVNSLSDVGNIDTTSLTDGSVLVYSSSTNKWVSTLNLHAQDMDAGEF